MNGNMNDESDSDDFRMEIKEASGSESEDSDD